MKKKFIPILLFTIFGMVACGGGNPSSAQPSADPSKPAPSSAAPSSVVSSSAKPSSEKTSSEAPSSEHPSSETPSSSIEPVVYSLSIDDKEGLTKTWRIGDKNREVDVTIEPEIEDYPGAWTRGEFVIESSNDKVVGAEGKYISAVGVGTATITVKYTVTGKECQDSLDITVSEEVIEYKPIKDLAEGLIAGTITKQDTFNIKGTVNAILGINGYCIQENGYGMYIYKEFPAGIEKSELKVGDVVRVKGTFTTYNGLPETNSVELCKLLNEEGEEIKATTIDDISKTTNANINTLVNVSGLSATGCDVPAAKAGSNGTGGLSRSLYIKQGDVATHTVFINYHVGEELAEAEYKAVIDAFNAKFDYALTHPCTIAINNALCSMSNVYQYVALDPEDIIITEVTPVNPTAIELTVDKTTVSVNNSFDVKVTFAPENCNVRGLSWTSSNPAVATVDAGKVTTLTTGTTTITATSTAEGCSGVTKSVVITVIDPDYDLQPVSGGHYLVGYEYSGAKAYLTGANADSSYVSETANIKLADIMIVTEGTGDNVGKFSIKSSEGKFLKPFITAGTGSYASRRFYNINWGDDEFFFDWDASNFCFTATIKYQEEETLYKGFVGRYYKGGKVGFNEYKYITTDTNAPLHIYREKNVVLDNVEVGDKVFIGLYQENLVKFCYLNALMSSTYCATVDNLDAAALFSIEAGTTEGSLLLKSSKGYLGVEKPEGKSFYVVKFDCTKDGAAEVFFDTELKAFKVTIPGETVSYSYIGTSKTGTFDTLGLVNASKVSTYFVAQAYDFETPTYSVGNLASEVKAGDAYLGFNNGAGKFWDGSITSNNLGVTDNGELAAKVTLISSDTGFKFKVGDKFLQTFVSDGTYVNSKLVNNEADGTVYTYNATEGRFEITLTVSSKEGTYVLSMAKSQAYFGFYSASSLVKENYIAKVFESIRTFKFVEPSEIVISGDANVKAGLAAQYSAEAKCEGASRLVYADVVWSIKDASDGVVASIDDNGKLTIDPSSKTGTVKVVATSLFPRSTIVGEKLVTVDPAPELHFKVVTTITSGNQYVIAINDGSDYGLFAQKTIAKNPAAVTFASPYDLVVGNAWTITEKTTGNYEISCVIDDVTYYLNMTNIAQGISISTTASGTWTFANNTFGHSCGTRLLSLYSKKDFRAYETGTQTITLYEYSATPIQ